MHFVQAASPPSGKSILSSASGQMQTWRRARAMSFSRRTADAVTRFILTVDAVANCPQRRATSWRAAFPIGFRRWARVGCYSLLALRQPELLRPHSLASDPSAHLRLFQQVLQLAEGGLEPSGRSGSLMLDLRAPTGLR